MPVSMSLEPLLRQPYTRNTYRTIPEDILPSGTLKLLQVPPVITASCEFIISTLQIGSIELEDGSTSGLLEKRHDGWGTGGVRVTTYSTRHDGSVTGENINDAGSSINLTRGYDSWGRPASQGTSWTSGTGPAFTAINAPAQTYAYSTSQQLLTIGGLNTESETVSLNRSTSGESRTMSVNYYGSYGYQFAQSWNLDGNGRAMGNSGSFNATQNGSPVYSSYVNLPGISQRWTGDRLAARTSGTDRRWEYRYNARGEVESAWQQSSGSVSTPTNGETLAGTGTRYSYDAIGNRTLQVDGGQGTSVAGQAPNGQASSTVSFTDQQNTGYPAAATNAANQYTTITHENRFNVRGKANFQVIWSFLS